MVLLVVVLVMLGTATKLKNARKIGLSGAVSGNANFDGSGNVNIETEFRQYNTSVSFAQKGEATITRRGNVVTVYATMNLDIGEAKTLANYATLPDWAVPSQSINPNDTYKSIRSSVGTDMNLKGIGYILVRTTLKQIAFVGNNTSTENSTVLTMSYSYVVD